MNYSAVLIDDEPKLQEVLKIKLKKHCPEIEVVGQAEDITSGERLIKETSPDIVFLDISMPGGSGFDLLDEFDHFDFEIIFVTGYSEYAIQALKISAVDYLLKPVATDDLIAAVARAAARIKARENIQHYEVLRKNIQTAGKQSSQIAIPDSHGYQFVTIEDIIRCEGWDKYTRIHLNDGSVLVSSYNIGVFKEMLKEMDFYETHKSHLINSRQIKSYHKEGTVTMTDGSSVPVARRKKEDFVLRYVKGSGGRME